MSGTIEQLKELKELLDQGVLTQEEFDAQKKEILEKPKTTQVAPEPAIVAQPATMQPGMMQPGMVDPTTGLTQRFPPPGCPTGGAWRMVKWQGPQTQQQQQFLALLGLLFMPAMGAGLICCCIAGAIEPQDDKEVYTVNGLNYTPNGILDENVGSSGRRG